MVEPVKPPRNFHCPACGANKSFFRLSRDWAIAAG
jgi:rubredoxin